MEQQLPQWKCHKIVRAAKIEAITQPAEALPIPGTVNPQGHYPAILSLIGGAKRDVDASWMARCNPVNGGYFVEYDDGYSSFSPASAFEAGYTRISDDYRDRVREEKRELDDRLAKLLAFASSPAFATVSSPEQQRMTRQMRIMAEFSGVLAERIGNFIPGKLAVDVSPGAAPVGIEHAVSEEDAIEAAIQAKGKTAPRVKPADIEANIVAEYSFTAAAATKDCPQHDALSVLTFCVLVLRNGFTVTGESACASPENFDAEIGRQIARKNAVDKIWPLMGYELKERLHRDSKLGCSP